MGSDTAPCTVKAVDVENSKRKSKHRSFGALHSRYALIPLAQDDKMRGAGWVGTTEVVPFQSQAHV